MSDYLDKTLINTQPVLLTVDKQSSYYIALPVPMMARLFHKWSLISHEKATIFSTLLLFMKVQNEHFWNISNKCKYGFDAV